MTSAAEVRQGDGIGVLGGRGGRGQREDTGLEAPRPRICGVPLLCQAPFWAQSALNVWTPQQRRGLGVEVLVERGSRSLGVQGGRHPCWDPRRGFLVKLRPGDVVTSRSRPCPGRLLCPDLAYIFPAMPLLSTLWAGVAKGSPWVAWRTAARHSPGGGSCESPALRKKLGPDPHSLFFLILT